MKEKKKMTGAQALVDSLAKAGTEVLFGYPGGSVLDIFDCLPAVPFHFILVYQPDSLNENQLLFEMARFNFSNFMVRNFDLEIVRDNGINRMMIHGFQNFDEALQYARQLHASETMTDILKQCRSLVISEHNLGLIGTRYSYKDYDEFYEKTFLPLTISNEDLLQTPDYEQPIVDEEDEESPAKSDSSEDDDDDFEDLW